MATNKRNNQTEISLSKRETEAAHKVAEVYFEAYVQCPEGSAGYLEEQAAQANDTVSAYMIELGRACKSDPDRFKAAAKEAEQSVLKEKHGIKYPSKEVPHWSQAKSNLLAGFRGVTMPDGSVERLKASQFKTESAFRAELNRLRKVAKEARKASGSVEGSEGSEEGGEAADHSEDEAARKAERSLPSELQVRINELKKLAAVMGQDSGLSETMAGILDKAIQEGQSVWQELMGDETPEKEESEGREAS